MAGGWLGKFTRLVAPKWESARPWGQMGQDGYSGRGDAVFNINTASDEFAMRAWGHSDEFSKEKSDYFLPYLAHSLITNRKAKHVL